MLNWLEKHFSFNRRELTGIGVLGALLLAIWLAPYLYRMMVVSEEHDNLTTYIHDIENFLATADVKAPTPATDETAPSASAVDEIAYFAFNPNGLSIVEWKRLGLSDRQIRTIKNYEAKGGRFRKKEDLKKIYTLHEVDYARLEPYIRLETEVGDGNRGEARVDNRDRQSAQLAPERSMPTPPVINLNGTDSIELQQLPGIGPVYASRIVRFRDRLGGFHDVTQLMEVYGFDSLRFNGLKDYIYIDTAGIRKIPINTADYHQLSNHPLISSKLANAIVQYRKQHGHYRTLDDLLGIAIMDADIFRKIVPYLTISDD